MQQPGFFPPMTSEAFQAYTNFWYAQAQAQAKAGQSRYSMPPTTTFAQPSAQLVVKLSKLVKEARQLGCEIFSILIDIVVAKN